MNFFFIWRFWLRFTGITYDAVTDKSFLALFISGSAISIALMWNHHVAVNLDPGYAGDYKIDEKTKKIKTEEEIVEEMEEELERCKSCNITKYPLVHHCRTCKKCVYMMDHHCMWISNCVGRGTMKYFFYFLLFTMILSTYGILSMYYISTTSQDKFNHLIFNPIMAQLTYNTYMVRKQIGHLICPVYVEFETLGLWPKDSNGADIIHKDYDPTGYLDVIHLNVSMGCFGMAFVMMWSLVSGQMSG